MNIEKLLTWSDEDWNALEDATATVAGFRAGHVITDDDMKAMDLVRRYEEDAEEQDRDQYNKGMVDGREQASCSDVAAMLAKIDELHGQLVVERSMAWIKQILGEIKHPATDPYADLWNFDAIHAPRSYLEPVERPFGKTAKTVNVVKSVYIWAAFPGGKTGRTRWLPDDERWEGMTKTQAPLAWLPLPEFPESLKGN